MAVNQANGWAGLCVPALEGEPGEELFITFILVSDQNLGRWIFEEKKNTYKITSKPLGFFKRNIASWQECSASLVHANVCTKYLVKLLRLGGSSAAVNASGIPREDGEL